MGLMALMMAATPVSAQEETPPPTDSSQLGAFFQEFGMRFQDFGSQQEAMFAYAPLGGVE